MKCVVWQAGSYYGEVDHLSMRRRAPSLRRDGLMSISLSGLQFSSTSFGCLRRRAGAAAFGMRQPLNVNVVFMARAASRLKAALSLK